MITPLLGPSTVARTTLVVMVACIYAGAVLFNNNLLFPWLEFDHFRSLLFLPAGLKLFLVMLLGWRAVLGICLGLAAVALSEFPALSLLQALGFGGSVSLSTWLTLQLVSRLLGVGYPWSYLTWRSLSTIALVVGSMDAISLELVMVALGYETLDHFTVETLQGAFGRVVGTFIFLAVSLKVRQHLAAQPAA